MFRRYFLAVNAGIRRGVAQHPQDAHVVNLPRVISPGYEFRQHIDGESVRAQDGVQLTAAGAGIAADLILRRLRRDGATVSPAAASDPPTPAG